ncbi:MAG: DUF1553 domain-containing protein, partial [Acidobacteria bacterium]|nr:DUF1553 domain-containing protein [Acidobacteriota bacterium]
VQTGGHWREVASSDAGQQLPEGKRKRRQELLEQIEELARRYDADGPQPIFAGRFRPPERTFVFQRGSPMSPGDEVEPAGLKVLNGDLKLRANPSGPNRRLAFANWLASAQNPLTARVMVNRLWHHVFGNGIVSTPSDFGEVGARPSHPELLDWLAAAFVEDGWSVKKMLRQIVMTEAFRQASTPREKPLAIDADNRLLWRFSPRRVEAEVIRDSILVAAGTLDQTIGGRSYRIHDVKKRFQQWTVVDNHGPQTWRRMIYQERMRGIDDQMFSAFDFPDGGQILAKRTVSTTPLQALNLMNGPLVTIQSEKVARRMEKEVPGDTAGQIRRAFELILNRPPTGKELAACTELVKRDGLPSLARALFSTNESVFLQ